MKILKVIHGYPMRYNAGSEVYSQTLCHGLADRHEVHVFTREEDPFAPDFGVRVETDPDDPRIKVHLINNARNRDRYSESGIDQKFAELLDQLSPDIVHVGHLNHLSTTMLQEAANRDIPIIYTLHDYWVMCPRGQFMQMQSKDHKTIWAACDGQEDKKCAERCYARYFSGVRAEYETDTRYWTDWVGRRMKNLREMSDLVDIFVAPARYLYQRYRDDFGLAESKLKYLDYGFDLSRFVHRQRTEGEPFTFGYIGTHIPAKGIHQLIEAFGKIKGNAKLRIWGRTRGQETQALKALALSLPQEIFERIEWLQEYKNQEIVQDVFNKVDAIVVPSIWVENSPLVIHEAQQAKVPVITADAGGMAEYVRHEVNGLVYEHRSTEGLASQMQRMLDDPKRARELGERGYLYSDDGQIPSIGDHVIEIEKLYKDVINRRNSARVSSGDGPWRITFDTNPDTCNLKCIMCEEHSPHSTLQAIRIAEDRPRREMPFELIRKTVAATVKYGLKEIIPSTMGEPLLYRNFEDILALCVEYGVKLNLTTNGTFPKLGASEWAKKIVPVTSDVKISWNGASKKTHEKIMLGSNWEKALSNIKTFISIRDEHARQGGNRCRVTFQMTFLESNINELPDIVRLAIQLGVDRLKGHHLWAHFGEIKDESMRRDMNAIRRWNAAVQVAHQIVMEHPLSNGRSLLLENIYPLDEEYKDDIAPGGQCPFLGKEVWVSAEGRFDPCCAPDAQRRTLGSFGNLNDTNLIEIWSSEKYKSFRSTYRSNPLCITCNMRKPVQELI